MFVHNLITRVTVCYLVRIALLCATILSVNTGSCFAQAPAATPFQPPSPPDVRYDGSPNYPLNTAMEVAPRHFGGDVPEVIYGQVNTYASTNAPQSIATDGYGNFYVPDMSAQLIYKITPAGVKSIFAGTAGVAGNANGPALAATFNGPAAIAFDSQGNMYVSENTGHRIRKIATDGTVSNFAGDGTAGNAVGNGAAAKFRNPFGLVVDEADNLYVADMGNNAIRKIMPNGDVSTLAGHALMLAAPQHITRDYLGNLYVTSGSNNTIRKVTTAGVISTYAGLAAGSFPGLQNIDAPGGLVMNAQSELFFTGLTKHQLYKIKPDGTLVIIAGSGVSGVNDGIGTTAGLNEPRGLVLGVDGNLYVADSKNDKIRQVIITGFTTDAVLPPGITFNPLNGKFSGTPTKGSPPTDYTVYAYNAGGASTAVVTIGVEPEPLPLKPVISYVNPQPYSVGTTIPLLMPRNDGGMIPETIYGEYSTVATGLNFSLYVTADVYGDVYVTEYGGNRIKKINVNPHVITAGPSGSGAGKLDGPADKATFSRPTGIVSSASGLMYVAEEANNRIRSISGTTPKTVSTLAGNDASTLTDGYGTSASFLEINDLGLDPSGNNLYVADRGHNVIRKINLQTDEVRVINAGLLRRPSGVDAAADGTLYVSDTENNIIKRVSPIGVFETFGTGFNNPRGIRVDGTGNLYVADQLNDAIKRISPDGTVTTVLANVNRPIGLALDKRGNLYIAGINQREVWQMSVSGYTIDKPLPAGLSFNSRTGIISGTPTTASPVTTYTITGYNGAGSSIATVNISVNAAPVVVTGRPNIKYPTPLTYIAYQPISPDIIPENTGGTVPATDYGKIANVQSGLNSVSGLTIGPDGFIYLCESGINQITKIDPASKLVVSRYGSGSPGANDGTTSTASFNNPYDVAIDAAGNMYVSDYGNNLIRKVTPAGVVTTLVNAVAGLLQPKGLALDATGAFLYVADEGNNKIRKIPTTSGLVTDVATGLLSAPADVAFDKSGNLYIANTATAPGQGSIIKIGANGQISTYASGLTAPRALQVDELSDNCYVNSNLRIDKSGNQVAFAGTSAAMGLALDGKGLLYYTELGTRNNTTGLYTSGLLKTMVVTGYYKHTDLPSGLNFDGKTGVISGSPQPTGSAFNYTITAFNVSGSSSFTINMRVSGSALTPQVITFPAIARKLYCNSPFAAGASSSNTSLPVTYTSSNTSVADVDANTGVITLKGIIGTALITASQAGNATYSDAVPKQQLLTVSDPVKPNVKVNDNRNLVCEGGQVTFEAIVNNQANLVNPSYRWLRNGTPVSGNNTASYVTTVAITDEIKCIVTNNDACVVTGEDMVTNVRTKDRALLSLLLETSAPNAVCEGTLITLTAKPSVDNGQNHYQWQLNGANLTDDRPTISSSTFKDGDVISCTFTDGAATCVVSPTATVINPIIVRITPADNPPPSVTISTATNSVYAETNVSFTAMTTNTTGSVTYQWQVNGVNAGSNSALFTSRELKNADKVTCIITNGACNPPATSNEIFMTVLPPVAIIPATAFTPNGDGVNDVWLIGGISAYPNSVVSIYNRLGASVFRSLGYSVPWDGRYQAKNLPTGTYYYIIDLANGKPKVSGYLSIVK